MSRMNRRSFMEMAVAIGATACWANPFAKQSKPNWQERRDLFPEGVASGDPDSHSVVLWTRYPETRQRSEVKLNVEVAEDETVRACDRVSESTGLGSFRLDLPRAGRRAKAVSGLLVPFCRPGRSREPYRPNHHRPGER